MGQASCQCMNSGQVVEDVNFKDAQPALLGKGKEDPTDDSYWKKKAFNYDSTTEDVFAVPHFTGVNEDIRPLLDYTYHKKYSEERTMLQDRLIGELCVAGAAQNDLLLPWVIFTAGAMGAGKGYVIDWLDKQGCLPLNQFVIVDPDQIRQALPEWDGYVAKDSMVAAVKTQKEAGHIAEILGYKALRERWNVIFDGSLRDVEWYKVYFQKLRHAFPGIRIMILHIEAEREEVLKRAEKRGKETGRMVPLELLESSLSQVPKSVAALAAYVDVTCKVLNLSNQEPKLEREPNSMHPPPGVPITKEFLSSLWKPIDVDGDGQLSKEEVMAAVACGTLTQEVLDTVDVDHDGAISKVEMQAAVKKCQESASVRYK